MKKLHCIRLLILAILCASCSKEAEITNGVELEYAYLNAELGTLTYGEAPTSDEKKLTSVAFFIKTANGVFHKYLSTEAINSVNGFTVVHTDDGGNCTGVSMKITGSNLSGHSTVVVIGNYAENGLTAALLAVTDMEELGGLRTETLSTAGIAPPSTTGLLMYDRRQDVNLQSGNAENHHFDMKRVAARIDFDIQIALNGQLTDAATAGITFVSIRLIYPKSESYLLPQEEKLKVTTISQLTKSDPFFPLTNTFESQYVYEMSGDEEEGLILSLVYELDGSQRLYNIGIEDKITGKSIINRNTVYNVPIIINVVRP